MVKVSTLLNKECPLVIDLGDDIVLNVSYRPGRLNGKLLARQRQLMAEGKEIEAVAEALAELIASWDLEDGKKPLPITKDNLAALPLAVLKLLWEAIQGDLHSGAAGKS